MWKWVTTYRSLLCCHHDISRSKRKAFSEIAYTFNFDFQDTFRFSKAPYFDPATVSYLPSKLPLLRIRDQAVRTIFIMNSLHMLIKIGRVNWCLHTARRKKQSVCWTPLTIAASDPTNTVFCRWLPNSLSHLSATCSSRGCLSFE